MPTFDELPQSISQLTTLVQAISGEIGALKSLMCPETNELLDINEAANFLRCKVSTIERFVRKGELRSSRKLKKHLFFKADLIEFIKSGNQHNSNRLYVESVLNKCRGKK